MEEQITAVRVTERQARRCFELGGTVLVSEHGQEKELTVGRLSTRWDKTSTTWERLSQQVREWRNRYPNQRYYVIPNSEAEAAAEAPIVRAGWL